MPLKVNIYFGFCHLIWIERFHHFDTLCPFPCGHLWEQPPASSATSILQHQHNSKERKGYKIKVGKKVSSSLTEVGRDLLRSPSPTPWHGQSQLLEGLEGGQGREVLAPRAKLPLCQTAVQVAIWHLSRYFHWGGKVSGRRLKDSWFGYHSWMLE